MNFFSKASSLVLAGAVSLILARAQDGSGSEPNIGSSNSTMIVSVSAPQGAMIVEASTNLVDWVDVSTLFPNGGSGIFIDTQSTNYSYRFYRIRAVISAANNVVTVNGVSDLRMLSAVTDTADVVLRGYYKPGDGGGGTFYWDPTSTDPDDGGVTIVPSSNPPVGRWKRSFDGAVNVKWFGAVGDGMADDAPRIQAALSYVNGKRGGKVFLPSGSYLVTTSPLWVGSNTTLEGGGAASVIRSNSGYTGISDFGVYPGGIVSSNIVIRNLTVDCAKTGNNGIVFNGTADSTIENVWVRDPRGYAIWLFRWGDSNNGEGYAPKHVTVRGCHITGVVDEGIELYGAVGCTVMGNTVQGYSGGGYLVWYGSTDCTVVGNVAEGMTNSQSFVGYHVSSSFPGDATPNKTSTQRVTLIGNVARNVWVGALVGKHDGVTNLPSDILIQGSTFLAGGSGGTGVGVGGATRVSVFDNLIEGFDTGLLMNDVATGLTGQSATYVFINNNTVKGAKAVLYGNVGGSLSGNKFYAQSGNAVSIYAWQHCTVNNNIFINPGVGQDTVGIAAFDYNSVGCTGNTFSGNICMDDRDTKYAIGTLAFNAGNHDQNIVTRNSAFGAKPGARAFTNSGSGTNNIVAENIDAPSPTQ